jgi:hypothetical protein
MEYKILDSEKQIVDLQRKLMFLNEELAKPKPKIVDLADY